MQTTIVMSALYSITGSILLAIAYLISRVVAQRYDRGMPIFFILGAGALVVAWPVALRIAEWLGHIVR